MFIFGFRTCGAADANAAGAPVLPFDAFQYNASSATDWTVQNVSIAAHRIASAPVSRVFRSQVSAVTHCILSGLNFDNTVPQVVLTDLPAFGALYQSQFGPGAPVYTNLLSGLNGELAAYRINVTNTTATNVRGAVTYIPPRSLFVDHPELITARGEIQITFSYAWRHPICQVPLCLLFCCSTASGLLNCVSFGAGDFRHCPSQPQSPLC